MNLNQVTLPVQNLEEAAAFYLKLGFTQIVDSPGYARFECPNGGATFSLVLEPENVSNGSVVYFEHERLDEWVQELMGKGVEFVHGPRDEGYLWKEALLKDPSGNRIKLYWAGENRVNPPWRIERRA